MVFNAYCLFTFVGYIEMLPLHALSMALEIIPTFENDCVRNDMKKRHN